MDNAQQPSRFSILKNIQASGQKFNDLETALTTVHTGLINKANFEKKTPNNGRGFFWSGNLEVLSGTEFSIGFVSGGNLASDAQAMIVPGQTIATVTSISLRSGKDASKGWSKIVGIEYISGFNPRPARDYETAKAAPATQAPAPLAAPAPVAAPATTAVDPLSLL